MWLFITPGELRQLADDMERKVAVAKLGQSLVVREYAVGVDTVLRVSFAQGGEAK